MVTDISIWTKKNIDSLIGQAESLRQEFKSSKLFTKSTPEIAKDLSVIVSAFANTEGGVIVIGIAEEKQGRARIAKEIDGGIDAKDWYPERMQQIIESCISPPLSGIRVKGISLDMNRTKYVYAISIPQGTTAYQAKDCCYYGRSEFETKPLLDHEIRLRMFRGKTANAQAVLINMRDRSYIEKGENDYWYEFGIAIENIGEATISEFKLVAEFCPPLLNQVGNTIDHQTWFFKDGAPPPINSHYFRQGEADRPYIFRLYPRDIFPITQFRITSGKSSLKDIGAKISWTLFLNDALPIRGEIDLAK